MSARKCPECGEVHLAGANGAIYCCGTLLRAVQMSGMFPDSKHFVDMPSRYSTERILGDWQMFCSCKKNETSLKNLSNFVENHFEAPGSDLESWSPPDWRREPPYMAQIRDPKLKKFAMAINLQWKQLGRRMKDCVRSNPLLHSLVYVPNPMIVPGGRFMEFYYWDTYWIVRALLHSGMIQTARGMIDNLLYIVSQFKFVPNGGRIYFWGRSQPPLLVPMVKAYVEATKDQKYAVQVLPILEMEIDNYLKNHEVHVKGRTMYQYRDKSAGPRPEAYREDIESASGFETDDEKEEHYSHIKAACESGMDFSSRWFISSNGNNVGTLADIKTTWIVPVDLNCILFRNCKTLAEFNTWAGNMDRADNYRIIAANLIKAITAVLWNEERGVWLDYDMRNKVPRDFFVVTNLSPLWARAYPINNADKITESVIAYIEENKLNSFPGGVPHTLSNTGERWDYPNVWPPMMHVLIEGFNNLGTPKAKEMSKQWRSLWVRSNLEAYNKTGLMYEKYNCEEFGSPGKSRDQDNQMGYATTNAIMIELLARYGKELTSQDGGCTCNDDESAELPADGLENCPITSELYLELKTQDTQTNINCTGSAPQPEESIMYCRTVYEADEPEKQIDSYATSQEECQCGQAVNKPIQMFATVASAPESKNSMDYRGNESAAAASCPPPQGVPCPPPQGDPYASPQGAQCPPPHGVPCPPAAAAARSPPTIVECPAGKATPAASATAARAPAPTGACPPANATGCPSTPAPECPAANAGARSAATTAPYPPANAAAARPLPPAAGCPPPAGAECPPSPAAEAAQNGCQGCPICKESCVKKKSPLYALASELADQQYCPKPIEIEMNDVDCLMGLTPSQQQAVNEDCGCEPSDETMDTVVCESDPRANEVAAKRDDDCECEEVLAEKEPSPKPSIPIKQNKIFPLSDENDLQCVEEKQDNETPEVADANCMCCLLKGTEKQKVTKECE